jgi:uncharacterized protein
MIMFVKRMNEFSKIMDSKKITTENKPLIAAGWLRALLFLIAFFLCTYLIAIIWTTLISMILQAGGSKEETIKQHALLHPLLQGALASLTAALICSSLFTRFINKEAYSSIGWPWKGHAHHAATGFFAGIMILGTGSFLLYFTGHLEWTDIHFNTSDFVYAFFLMLAVSAGEEIAIRGYLLNNLMRSMNKWLALIVSALVFSALHLNNPDISIWSLADIFAGGLLLGVNYIFTRNLWFGIFLHFSWNFFQGPVLGYKVSGLALGSVLEQEVSGSDWLTGGAFGFEGSAIATGLILISTVILGWVYQRRERMHRIADNASLLS